MNNIDRQHFVDGNFEWFGPASMRSVVFDIMIRNERLFHIVQDHIQTCHKNDCCCRSFKINKLFASDEIESVYSGLL